MGADTALLTSLGLRTEKQIIYIATYETAYDLIARTTTNLTSGSGTFTLNSSMNIWLEVLLLGGGGGGANGNAGHNAGGSLNWGGGGGGGGGGGSCAYLIKEFVNYSTAISYSVGSGGAPGGDSGATTFGTYRSSGGDAGGTGGGDGEFVQW